MSGRLATPRTNCRVVAGVAFVALAGLACGLAAGPAHAQPGSAIDLEKVDRKAPVPADTPRRKPHEKFAVPDPHRAIFGGIRDFEPVASQDKNRPEYDAWIEVVLHANGFEADDLERHAARDLTPVDLLKSIRTSFRLELIRFDGRINCVRRLTAPPTLQFAGLGELYEVRLVPTDESPLTPISVVFTRLPESLAAVRQKAPGEWLDADAHVSAAGYYFKTMNVPGEQGNAVIGVPILIGKSVTPRPDARPTAAADPVALDKNVRVYKFIRDDAPMSRNAPTDATWPEVEAYHRVILHASRFPARELEEAARRDLKFADLFEPSRTDYKLELVRLEGRLISLRRLDVSDWLKAAGVQTLYEGWLVPANEPSGNPVCVLFTEPLEGVEASGRVNKWVSFAGYSFKLMRYESAERDDKDPTKFVVKRAPLLIGRGPIPRPDPDAPTAVTWRAFMLGAVLGGVALIGLGLVLAWRYRRGDRKLKREVDAALVRNPFDPAGGP